MREEREEKEKRALRVVWNRTFFVTSLKVDTFSTKRGYDRSRRLLSVTASVCALSSVSVSLSLFTLSLSYQGVHLLGRDWYLVEDKEDGLCERSHLVLIARLQRELLFCRSRERTNLKKKHSVSSSSSFSSLSLTSVFSCPSSRMSFFARPSRSRSRSSVKSTMIARRSEDKF